MGKHSDRAQEFLWCWRVYGTPIQPVAEYGFDHHLGRKHRFDFAFPDYKVAVEVDGGTWAPHGGRHGTDKDREKLNLAASLGWKVFRFSPQMLQKDPETSMNLVKKALLYNPLKT